MGVSSGALGVWSPSAAVFPQQAATPATGRWGGQRGDGRLLTRGAGQARRGLDHWAAEGAARRAGPGQEGPLICLYYPRETKLPGTDAGAPSCPPGTLTAPSPPRHGPSAAQGARHPPRASCPSSRVKAPLPASPGDLDLRHQALRGVG